MLMALESNSPTLVRSSSSSSEKSLVGTTGRGSACGGCTGGLTGRRMGGRIEGRAGIREDNGLSSSLSELWSEELTCSTVPADTASKICKI